MAYVDCSILNLKLKLWCSRFCIDTLAYIWSRIVNYLLFLKNIIIVHNLSRNHINIGTTRKSEFWAFQGAFIGVFSLVLSRDIATLVWKLLFLPFMFNRPNIQIFYTESTVSRLTQRLESTMRTPRKAQTLFFHVVSMILPLWLQIPAKSAFFKKSR